MDRDCQRIRFSAYADVDDALARGLQGAGDEHIGRAGWMPVRVVPGGVCAPLRCRVRRVELCFGIEFRLAHADVHVQAERFFARALQRPLEIVLFLDDAAGHHAGALGLRCPRPDGTETVARSVLHALDACGGR